MTTQADNNPVKAGTAASPGIAPGASAPILELGQVHKRFVRSLDMAEKIANLFGAGLEDQVVRAVDDVNLSVAKGEVVGLVGESGCGKSTLGRVIAGILEASAGTVKYHGKEVSKMVGTERRATDLAIQMIFQDPMASLNPRMRVVDIIGEAPVVHGIIRRNEIDGYVSEVMRKVGLDPATRMRYPHQFSGGQRARIGIARALAVNPKVLVCDESTAALDVSIQAQVLNLFMDLRRELDLTYVFVSHDLGVVEHISDRVAVMYLGRIVELAGTDAIFERPNHPYTRALLDEVPRLDAKKKHFTALKGEIPSPLTPPPGCHFHPRCPFAFDRCRQERPALKDVGKGRLSACHLNDTPEGNPLMRENAPAVG
ncbi:MAG: peptide/nickel transport system ATP-binding protein [Saliniramus fredricksonii]|uniref:Peptide/nickel transport system ATP-binding protein n=2 Tax=Saliniramus fredricksonii TaxID=1653334 RepID=A0A0P7Y6P6_9HYPH|nr:MAG: peptide/nickel transport system ATP-binding protein [Saliniramus fredricksonii]SCC80873.1 peptide/nickel transport system ATP-binding protein [Saliniramus fredricksonii]